MAFVVVTYLIISLNNNYNNIFEFDFTEVKMKEDFTKLKEGTTGGEILMLKNYLEHEFKSKIIDSVKANTPVKVDTVYKEVVEDQSLLDSLNKLNTELQKAEKLLALNEEKPDSSKQINKINKDWIRKTSKLLEEMDPKRAAKVIMKYSDNEARELIYAMKQKKAAEILSLLDPIFVNKITSSRI